MLQLDGKRLRRGLTLVVAFAATILAFAQSPPAPPPAPATRIKIDYVFLVDVSESMIGRGGRFNIFPEVIKTIQNFVRKLDPGTNVYVIPFAERVRETREFAIRDPEDLERLVAYLGALEADGDSTAVYDSIKTALDLVEVRRGEAHRNDHAFVLQVYTDGIDNVSVGWSLERILEHYRLRRGRYDYLFYTELGLPRDAAKQETFSGRENVVYVSEKAGEVRPIIQVEALLSFLNFGNVVDGKSPTRSVKFAIRSSQPPPKLSMNIEPRFEELRAAGVLAEIEPSQFPIDTKDRPLTLTLKNPLPHGVYRGHLKLTTNDPYVLVIPDEIGAIVSYEIPKTIRITPAAGERLPIDFGEVKQGTSAARHFRVAFDAEARKASATFDVRFHEVTSNPTTGGAGQTIYLEGSKGKKHVVVGEDTDELTIILQPPLGWKPGRYSGTLDFSSDTAQLILEGSPTPGSSPPPPIGWQFVIPEPPTPWWVWALVVAALIVVGIVFYKLLTRPPTFSDFRLQLLAPTHGVIDLAGQHSMRFGPSSQVLSDAVVDFTIRAMVQDRRKVAVIEAVPGRVKIMRKGNKRDVIESDELFAGDIIEVPPYQLRVESFGLGSEDSV